MICKIKLLFKTILQHHMHHKFMPDADQRILFFGLFLLKLEAHKGNPEFAKEMVLGCRLYELIANNVVLESPLCELWKPF